MATQTWEQIRDSFKQKIESTLKTTLLIYQNTPMDRAKEVAIQNREIWINLKKEISDQLNHGMPKPMGEQLIEFCDKKFIAYSKEIQKLFR